MENKELDGLLGESEEKLSEYLLDGKNLLVNKVEEEEGKEELSDAPAEAEEKENSEEKSTEESKDKEEKSESEEKSEEESKDKEEKSESEEKSEEESKDKEEKSESESEEESKDKEEKSESESEEESKDKEEKSEEESEEESKDKEEKSESEEKDEKKDELKEVNENMENIFDILKSLNEELSHPTVKKDPAEDKVELDNEDIYNKETEPVKAEEVSEPTVKKDPAEDKVELDNEDIYNKETEPVKAEEVKEVIVDAPIATINHDTDGNPISGTYDDSPEAEATVKEKLEKDIHAEDKITKNGSEVKHYIDPKNPEKEEVKEYIEKINNESFSDFELMQWLDENGYEPTFENVAILREELLSEKKQTYVNTKGEKTVYNYKDRTVETELYDKNGNRIGEAKHPNSGKSGRIYTEELDNSDLYNKETEPVKTEDVEPVDQPAQKDKLPIEKSNEDKEYDVDEEYAAEKTAKIEPKDILKESVAYGSLKEALVLGTEYFTEDTYTLDTAEAKQAKLIEQVALSLGKESMDPIYDELLKSAVYTQRLQEALVEKYGKLAANKVSALMEADNGCF